MANQFVAKKLGEILAFSIVGKETYIKGSKSLSEKLGDEKVTDVIGHMENQAASIRAVAEGLDVLEKVEEQAQETTNEVREMRDVYLGGAWDDAIELLEWSGFFEGAALVHYAVVAGIATELGHNTLLEVANEGNDLHQLLLDQAHEELYSVGQDKAQ